MTSKIGEMFPLCLYHKTHRNPIHKQQDMQKGKDIYRGGENEGSRMGEEEIVIGTTETTIGDLRVKRNIITLTL